VLEKVVQVHLVDVMVTAVDHWCVRMEENGIYMELSAMEKGIVQLPIILCLHV